MKASFFLVFGSFLVATAFSRDFLPQTWFEDVPASDASIQKSYVFNTLPGVLYTVETSHDMSNWMAVDEVYGLGGDYVVPLYEYTPPPPPPPGSGVPLPHPSPAKNVSLCIQPCSDNEGGTIVSWASLANGQAIKKRLAQSLTVNWQTQPYFWNRFGNFNFMIMHPRPAASAPEVDPELGPLDAAMFAQLATSFPGINQAIDDNHVRARNQPPPAPSDPNSRKFWRIRCDWGVDSDGDGSPDWAEFEIAAGNGTNQVGLQGDAFDADTDHNGVRDGDQLDLDQDGTPDSKDPDKSGGVGNAQDGRLVTWARPPGFLFAAFELPPLTGDVIDLSENGTVLSLDSASAIYSLVDRNFQHYDYPRAQPILADPVGKFCSITNALIGDSVFGARLVEKAGFQNPIAEETLWEPVAGVYSSVNGFSFGYDDQIQDQRRGIRVETNRTAENELRTTQGPLAGSDTESNWALLESNGNVVTARGYWRNSLAVPHYGTKVTLPEEAKAGSATLIQVTPAATPEQPPTTHTWNLVPGSSSLLISTDNGAFEKSAVNWKKDQTPVGATRFGWLATGSEIWNYDKWSDLDRHFGDSQPYRSELHKILDSGLGVADLTYLPGGVKKCLVVPISVIVTDPMSDPLGQQGVASGVDFISMMAHKGSGFVPEIWIMAPNGGVSKQVHFLTPMNTESTMHLVSDDRVQFIPELLNSEDQTVQVSGKLTNTGESFITLNRSGTHNAINLPLKVKAMKKRTITIALHKVLGLGDTSAQTTPEHIPTSAQLTEFLDELYGPQVNTSFTVLPFTETGPHRLYPEEEGIDFDLNNDHKIMVSLNHAELVAATPNARVGLVHPTINTDPNNPANDSHPENVSIDVWVLGGDIKLYYPGGGSISQRIIGAQFGAKGEGKVLIDGSLTNVDLTDDLKLNLVMSTIAHEIGHVMVGKGHADEGEFADAKILNWDKDGSADPYIKLRLMASGLTQSLRAPGKCLIKKEWDAIDEWLKSEELRLGRSL